MKFTYGCRECYDVDASQAWSLYNSTAVIEPLLDEQQFSIRVHQCTACDQRYLAVFTEKINWKEREVPQQWSVVPVSVDEIAALRNACADGGDLPLVRLVENAFAERQCLCLDWPKGSDRKIFWRQGIIIDLYD